MALLLANLWPFLVYWLILFVGCFVVVDYAQKYFYDETTPAIGLKIALGSMMLALLATWTRSSFDTMFTEKIHWTILQAIVWFAIFTLVFRFQPQHGAAIGIIMMLLFVGLASLAVDSLPGRSRPTLDNKFRPRQQDRIPPQPARPPIPVGTEKAR
jgi:hypothetical protein